MPTGPITLGLLHASDAPTRFLPPLVDAVARVAALADAAPRGPGLRLVSFDAAADPPAPDAGDTTAADCDALLCLPPFRPLAFRHMVERGAAGKLRWIHSVFTGVEPMLAQGWFARVAADIPLTNSKGSAGPALSEWVAMAMLYFCKDIPRVRAAQRARVWEPFLVGELADRSVGILGLGGIGCAIARKCAALGVGSVWGLRRAPAGRPDGIDASVRVGGIDELDALLAASDYVVSALPHTPATRGLLDAGAIARMKPGAVLINVGRGCVLDEDAVADAIERGALAGAALDVFHTEPLPASSRLWALDRVLVSPHTADTTHSFTRGVVAGFEDNLTRFLRGDPLAAVVDRRSGY